MKPSLRAALLLLRLPALGPATYWRLLEVFPQPQELLAQPLENLRSILKPATLDALSEYQQSPETSLLGKALEHDLEWLDQHPDIHLLDFQDARYPELLRQIRKPPPVLFVRGNPDCLGLPQIALVGSRNPTPTGHDNAVSFARFLASSGFAITSGLALGIDGAAHRGALDAGGKTIAVLGTGIDRIYPARHHRLAQEIIATGGALVSEFPLGTSSIAANFPQRNRIITGLSCGTLVVEAAIQSGSLISARLAMEQNREVFAIPGSIHNPLARGCHRLIRDGAKLVETGEDILEELGGMISFKQQELDECREPEARQPLEPNEQAVFNIMSYDPEPIDILVERSGMPVGILAAVLIGLELKGAISQSPAGYSRRT